MTNLKLTLLIWSIGHVQSILFWLQGKRFDIIEAELTKLEKGE